MSAKLKPRAYAALLSGARIVSPSAFFDEKGYATIWTDNLLGGLPLKEISNDLGAGAGQELAGKLRAAHSSAALAVNTFGQWRTNPASLQIAGLTGFVSLRFEATFPTGLGGTPPHLDLHADGAIPIAVESKCTEWMKPTVPVFATAYDQIQPSQGHCPWFGQILQLRAHPARYQFLDAAQLVKHALGLLKCYRSREVRLLYLYWEPQNAEYWPECRLHRAEAEDLAARVRQSNVQLLPMSYGELWSEWKSHAPPPHLHYLESRYLQDA